MNTSNITNPKARFWGFAAMIPFGIFAFFIASYIWIAITGVLGMIAFALICVAAWFVKDVVFTLAANTRLLLLKRVVMRNPVETLQEEWRRKSVGLEERRVAITDFKGKIMNLEDKTEKIKTKYGVNNPDYKRFSGMVDTMNRVHEGLCAQWRQAENALNHFAQEVEKAGYIWEAAVAAHSAQEASGLAEEEFFAKLKTDTAFDHINSEFNEAVAGLDSTLMRSKSM